MTYSKKALLASAITLIFGATPAFAGDHGDHSDKMMKKEAMKAEQMLTKANDTVGEILQADGQPDPQSDNEIVMSEGGTVEKSVVVMKERDNEVANNAIVVPTLGTNVATTVTCPVGTTAQPDMTCMVTGDYEPAIVTTGADVKMTNQNMNWSSEKNWDKTQSDIFIIRTGEEADYSEYKGTLRPNS